MLSPSNFLAILILVIFSTTNTFAAPVRAAKPGTAKPGAAKQPQTPQRPRAFFVFGDSLVDNGNNNYLLTTARADSPPYGVDTPTHLPSGRFSNGLNIPDLISKPIIMLLFFDHVLTVVFKRSVLILFNVFFLIFFFVFRSKAWGTANTAILEPAV